jgi:hypothetical protein
MISIAALVLGVLISVMAFYVERQTVFDLSDGDVGAWQNILAGVGSSFLFLFVIDAATNLAKWFTGRLFRKVFGDNTRSRKLILVYPKFVLSEEVKAKIAEVDQLKIYAK